MELPSQKKISHPSPLCSELLVLVLAPQIEVGDIHKQGFGFDANWKSWEHSDWEMVESSENRCQKQRTPYQPCVSRCHITGLCARADDMIRASPRAQMEVPVASVLHLWTASSAAAGKPAETAVCSPVSSTRGHGMPAEALTCFHLCEAE